MRRRILLVAISTLLLAAVLLGVPLTLSTIHGAESAQRSSLERAALRAATAIGATLEHGDPAELPTSPSGTHVAVYTTRGVLIQGDGPTHDDNAALATHYQGATDADEPGTIAVAVPVSSNEQVIAVVIARSSTTTLHTSVAKRLLALGGLAAVALALASGFAFWQARRLAHPMDALAAAAAALGAGDFAARAKRSGVPEIDKTADTLATTAQLLASHLERERRFAAQASHQLRTPLTRLQLELETGLHGPPDELVPATERALAMAEHLSETVDDVLAIARSTPAVAGMAIDPLIDALADVWRGPLASQDRPLRVRLEPGLQVAASASTLRQILQVLLDNAYRHGVGVVTITARTSGSTVAIDVEDEGTADITWPPPGSANLGLPMAKALAADLGGRLVVAAATNTRFTLLLPCPPTGPPEQPLASQPNPGRVR